MDAESYEPMAPRRARAMRWLRSPATERHGNAVEVEGGHLVVESTSEERQERVLAALSELDLSLMTMRQGVCLFIF